MSRRRALAIVENAFRGAVEQQYAHVLWLVRSLHGEFEMTVWLRGAAALYALPREPPAPLTIAGTTVFAPDYEATARALLAAGSTIYVSADSLRELGVGDAELVDGVRRADDAELAAVCAAHEFVWYL